MIRSSKTNEINELSLIQSSAPESYKKILENLDTPPLIGTIIVKFLNSWYVYS